MRFNKLFILASMMIGISFCASAQKAEKNYYPYPHMFIGVQGGVENSFSKGFNRWDHFNPVGSVYFGGFLDNVIGARLHVNGSWGDGFPYTLMGGEIRHFNYITPSADVLINLCTLVGQKESYPANLLFIVGLGTNYAWSKEKTGGEISRMAFNGRVGLGLDVPVHKYISLTLETDLNYVVPGNASKFAKDNLQFMAQMGLNFKFGYKKKPVPEKTYVTRVDTIWYDDSEFVPRVEDGKATWNVFYLIRESNFEEAEGATEQLAAIGAFLADHRECKVDIKSYADVETGNPKINMEYSQQRNEKAVRALVDAGVERSQITANYYGDTVQPFAENDKNRVSIITATGLKDVKDKKTVKRFRTKEYQVEVEE